MTLGELLFCCHGIASVQYMQIVAFSSPLLLYFLSSSLFPYYVVVADFFRQMNEEIAADNSLLKVLFLISLFPCPTHIGRKSFLLQVSYALQPCGFDLWPLVSLKGFLSPSSLGLTIKIVHLI